MAALSLDLFKPEPFTLLGRSDLRLHQDGG
jgi:hypothetical protein